MARSPLVEAAVAWVQAHYWNAPHLVRALEWLEQLDPAADEAVQLATVLHDIERAFPGPEAPVWDATRGPDDPDYNRRHAERSARIAGQILADLGAGPALSARVQALIAAHEEGGWPEADLVQAADSLSFLETNVDLVLRWLAAGQHGVGPAEALAKLRYMRDRIRLPQARPLAARLYAQAVARVQEALRAGGPNRAL